MSDQTTPQLPAHIHDAWTRYLTAHQQLTTTLDAPTCQVTSYRVDPATVIGLEHDATTTLAAWTDAYRTGTDQETHRQALAGITSWLDLLTRRGQAPLAPGEELTSAAASATAHQQDIVAQTEALTRQLATIDTELTSGYLETLQFERATLNHEATIDRFSPERIRRDKRLQELASMIGALEEPLKEQRADIVAALADLADQAPPPFSARLATARTAAATRQEAVIALTNGPSPSRKIGHRSGAETAAHALDH